jgi:hypothetical protein
VKCPICTQKQQYKKDMIHHISLRHFRQLPENMSPAKFLFASTHGGRNTGICRVCSNETPFDEQIGKPKVLCSNPSCKQAFATIAQSRNIVKFGVPHLLNDQKHQMFMLSKRKISGEYDWSDGRTKIPYVGSYEKRFLEFMDNFIGIDPITIHSPCPFDIHYEFDGETHTYTPDFYIDILDLIVEIKHGGDNPNNHHKIQAVDVKKDKVKQDAIKKSTNHNFIKVVDNKFGPLLKAMFKLIEDDQYESKQRLFMINESAQVLETQSLASISPIVTGFVGREIDYKEKPLYVTVFNDESDNYKVGLSLESTDNPIIYDKNKFQYLNESDLSLKDQNFSVYRYIGIGNPINNYAGIVKNIMNENSYNSDAEAFTSVMESVFIRPVYNVGQILMNPEFIKIKQGKVV